MNITAFIFARGGSKGLEGKNLKSFAGKPLIAWTIEQALRNSRVNRIIVSTDSPEIARISTSFGAEVPFMRPAELATDESPELESWKHALRYLSEVEGRLPEIFLSLPCTSPLRNQNDINSNLDCLIERQGDLAITVTPSSRNPYFNMVKVESDRTVSLAIASETNPFRRQDAPILHDITTIAYSARPNYILKTDSLLSGKVCASFIERDRAVDIDTEMDFEFAELLFLRGNQADA
jgi:CMP-N-acetylneuraminic acid synthetase